jgi:3-oxoacyl-[acyl-carrier protein] reductase
MDLGLRDKVALVSGSTRGIGFSVAKAFLTEGARVVITGRDASRLGEATAMLTREFGDQRVAGFEADFTAGDEAIASALQAAHDRFGVLDALVANVGGGRGLPALESDVREWERMLSLNLISAAITARHAAPLFPGAGGSITLIASIAGIEALPAPAAYIAAKAGVIALGKALARELASRRIRVNVVSPGNVLHPGGSWEERLRRDPEGTNRYIQSEVPLARFATAAEIAAAVVFLSSDSMAGFITGANLVVDGGQTRGF